MATVTQLNGLTIVESSPSDFTITDDNGYIYHLTDAYNTALHEPGRLHLRNVKDPDGEILVGFATTDYQLQASTTMALSTTPRTWYDYQGEGKSSMRLAQYTKYYVDYFEVGYSVVYFEPTRDQGPVAVVEHVHRFYPNGYEHAVRRIAMTHLCIWLEYAAVVPTRGVVHTTEYIDEITLEREDGSLDSGIVPATLNGVTGKYFDLEGVGILGPLDPSDYANVGVVGGYTMHLAHDDIVVTLNRPMELQIGDHGGAFGYGRVIPYAMDHFGVRGVDAGDVFQASWRVEVNPK